MDQRLWPRRRLSDLALTGGRHTARLVVRGLILATTALAALALAVQTHRVCSSWNRCDPADYGPPHALLSDTGPAPFAFFALIAVLQVVAFRRRMLAGLLAALGSMVAALFVFGFIVVAHLLSQVEGDGGATLGTLMVFVLAAAQIALEPVLAAAERRHLERADPVFPRATVVERRG